MEKLLYQAFNFRILVLEEQGHIAHIALDLDHIIEGEMGDDSEGGLSDLRILLMQVLIEILVIGFDDVGEAVKQIAHSDDYVVFDD